MMWIILLGFVALLGLLAPFAGVNMLRERRRILDTPVRPVRQVEQGPVAVHGQARPFAHIVGPFSGKPVVWCEYEVQEYVSSGRGKSRIAYWSKIRESRLDTPFIVDDGTGQVLVASNAAVVDVDERFTFQNADDRRGRVNQPLPPHIDQSLRSLGVFVDEGARALRVVEHHIAVGDAVFIRGEASRHPADIADAVGFVEPDEGTPTPTHVITGGDGKPDPYISLGDDRSVQRKLLMRGMACLTLGPLASVVCGGILTLLVIAARS